MAPFLFLVRKRAKAILTKSTDYLYTLLALGLPLFFRSVMEIGTSIILTIVAGVLGVAGGFLVMGGFLSLNRSFARPPSSIWFSVHQQLCAFFSQYSRHKLEPPFRELVDTAVRLLKYPA